MEHAKMVTERVVDKMLMEIVNLDGMQFGVMRGNGTVDVIWIVR